MVSSILERNTRDPLFGLTPAAFERELRHKLKGRVDAAYVFGSYGTPSFGPDSDVDLILVKVTDTPFVARSAEFADLLELVPGMDLLVYTPAEFERLTTMPSPGFWCSVVATLRPLF